VAQAKANLIKSQADVEHNRVALTDAQQKYTRTKELAARNLLPQSDLDAAKIAVDSAEAMLRSSEATVEQAKATLNQNEVNLEHSIIEAPIDGIVTQRSVDVGQTVAASMQAPTLFIIAADLTKMQVNANIDEADVGRIRPHQHVTFRVDAYPTDVFEGTVAQIRLQPVVVQNVTTYGTVIDVPNPELKLKPGMTANVKVEIARKSDTLRVPNTALRFRPTTDMFTALNQAIPPEIQFAGGRNGPRGPGGSGGSSGSGRSGGSGGSSGSGGSGGSGRSGGSGASSALQTLATPQPAQAQKKPSELLKPKYGTIQQGQTIDALFAPLPVVETRGRAWLFIDHQLKPVSLRLGITDGTNTEILSGELQDRTEVVTSITGLGPTRAAGNAGTGNPLMPGGRGQGGFGGGGGGRGGR
jgi:RND family efflux transporter MFP subunit